MMGGGEGGGVNSNEPKRACSSLFIIMSCIQVSAPSLAALVPAKEICGSSRAVVERMLTIGALRFVKEVTF